MRHFPIAVFCCLLASLPAWPQFELGSIVGLVTDPQRAPVAGATVEIRSLTTNVKREVTTSVIVAALLVRAENADACDLNALKGRQEAPS